MSEKETTQEPLPSLPGAVTFDPEKMSKLLELAKLEADRREALAWEEIKILTCRTQPETLERDELFVVGKAVYQAINDALGYIPLFVHYGFFLGDSESYVAKKQVRFRLPYKHILR